MRARRGDLHVPQPELDGGLGGNDGAVLEIDEIDLGAGRRSRGASSGPGGRRGRRGVGDLDPNARRHDRRRVRDVILVSQQQLQRVLAGRERDLRLGLAGAVMQMIEVVRNRLVERRQVGVDQQVVVTGMLAIQAGRPDTHVPQAEMDRQLGRNGGAVLDIDEVHLGSGRRSGGTSGAVLGVLRMDNAARRHRQEQQQDRDHESGSAGLDPIAHAHARSPSALHRLGRNRRAGRASMRVNLCELGLAGKATRARTAPHGSAATPCRRQRARGCPTSQSMSIILVIFENSRRNQDEPVWVECCRQPQKRSE